MISGAKDVIIIGGGFAGLSAGVALASNGFRVALLESKPALGGRAYSFADSDSGDFVDNGQHVLMGCYTETLDFLARIGAARIWFFTKTSKSKCSIAAARARRANRASAGSVSYEHRAAALSASYDWAAAAGFDRRPEAAGMQRRDPHRRCRDDGRAIDGRTRAERARAAGILVSAFDRNAE